MGILLSFCALLNICALNAPTSQSPKPLAVTLDNIIYMIITATIKDRILFYLCNDWPLEQCIYRETSEILAETETDFETLKAVLNQFERFGFLEQLGVGHEHTTLILLVDSHDFYSKGGFVIQQEIYQSNFDKLAFEIEHLKKELGPDHLDSLSKISSIVGTLLTAAAMLPK